MRWSDVGEAKEACDEQGNCIGCKWVGLLVAIGAMNWGLVGILKIDLVERLLGPMTTRAAWFMVLLAWRA